MPDTIYEPADPDAEAMHAQQEHEAAISELQARIDAWITATHALEQAKAKQSEYDAPVIDILEDAESASQYEAFKFADRLVNDGAITTDTTISLRNGRSARILVCDIGGIIELGDDS